MKSNTPEQHLGLRVPVDLLRRFAQVAAAEERSTSAELRRLMRERVKAAEAAAQAAGADGRH